MADMSELPVFNLLTPANRFKKLSLLLIAVSVCLLGLSTSVILIKILIERDQQLNAGFIGSYLDQQSRSKLTQQGFAETLQHLARYHQVGALNLYDTMGSLLWSSSNTKEQTTPIKRDYFQKALQGNIALNYTRISDKTLTEDTRKLDYFLPWLPDLYLPSHNRNGEIVGVAQVTRIPELLMQEIIVGLIAIWGGLTLSGIAYYWVTYRLFMQTSNELVSCELDLEKSRRLAEVGECVSMIVHDTRNLMASIRFILERLRSDSLSPDKRNAMVNNAKRPLEMSFAMMEDMLAFVSGKKPPLQCFKHNLKKLIDEAQDMLTAMLATPGHELIINIPDDLVLYWDDQKMLHILVNLVRNSSEAMHEPGNVTITATRQDGGVRVLVHDTGPGIPEEMLPTIFEPFTSEVGKTRPGLGLAIIRDLVRRHGGDVKARNRAEGGAEFDLFFPDCPVFSNS